MENKRYIDKVIGSLVRGTKIDYENDVVYLHYLSHFPSFPLPLPFSFVRPPFLVSSYCKNKFGLTHEEMNYVWEEYRNIIIDDGQ